MGFLGPTYGWGAQCAHRLLLSYFLSRILGIPFLIAMQSTLYNKKNEVSLVEIESHLGRFKVPQTLRKNRKLKTINIGIFWIIFFILYNTYL